MMSEEWIKYVEDSRKVCKYGAKCYQKNPEHHKTFKHPPAKRKHENNHQTPNKKIKKDIKIIDPKPVDTSSELVQPITLEKDKNDRKTCIDISNNDLKFYNDITEPDILIKHKFLVKMPSDFYKFYECLSKESNQLEKILDSVNLELIGPYDALSGKLPVLNDVELYLIHWRFFYDPPEFQAILKQKGQNEYHIGYFRDEPDEDPVFVGSSNSAKDCKITPMAYNIFGSVYIYLQNQKKQSPFISVACQRLAEKVKKWAEEYKFTLEEYDMKKRISQTVTKTFHGAGIVVPYNKKSQLGYRPLVETDANIRKLFKQIESASSEKEKDVYMSKLQPVITYANIAVDECDFGTGLECGINLFCSGLKELEPSALSTLCSVYTLLNRDAFKKIIQAHLKYRRKGSNMSALANCS